MDQTKTWFVVQRAEALAIILLTERLDLFVTRSQDDSILDLNVEILKNGKPTGRRLGIEIKARVSGKLERSTLDTLTRQASALLFPACLFYFTMKDEQGHYCWLTEPYISTEGEPKLRSSLGAELKNLDDAALDSIIEQVNQWYDALTKSLAA